MRIQKILDIEPEMLREIVLNYASIKEGRNNCLLLSAGLWRIRHEKLFKEWGHRRIHDYCQSELRMTVQKRKHLLALYARLVAHGFTSGELDTIQSFGLTPLVLTRITQTFPTKEAILEACQHPERLKRTQNELRQQIEPILGGYEKRRLHYGPFLVNNAQYLLIHDLFALMRRRYNMRQTDCLIASTLMMKVMIESKPEDRYGEMRWQCFLYGINMGIADLFFGGEAWKGERK